MNLKKIWEKILLNSVYILSINPYFYLFNREDCDKITEKGIENLNKITKEINKK